MAAAAQWAKENRTNPVLHCSLDIPAHHLSRVPAAAFSFDRWGAVVQVLLSDVHGRAVSARDSILLDVALPVSHAYGRRAIHCIGSATHVSSSTAGSLWLVLRFSQLHIRQLEPAPSPNPVSAFPSEGDRDRSVSDAFTGTTGSGL